MKNEETYIIEVKACGWHKMRLEEKESSIKRMI